MESPPPSPDRSPVWAKVATITSVTAVLANWFGRRLLRGGPSAGATRHSTDTHHDQRQEAREARSDQPDRALSYALALIRLDSDSCTPGGSTTTGHRRLPTGSPRHPI